VKYEIKWQPAKYTRDSIFNVRKINTEQRKERSVSALYVGYMLYIYKYMYTHKHVYVYVYILLRCLKS
jgi:hypothetical protein